ncbi:MAG: hypothetical protein L6R41_005876 [Letrouitia leprolyta]|nr:MAG: hypothetical protein L6R41_005876 [Letrouitia leprolyta]
MGAGTSNHPFDSTNTTLPPYAVKAIANRLDEHADRLFDDEDEATINFLDLEDDAKDQHRQWLKLCYSLKSVEPSQSDDWSVRQCAVHHTFDLVEVQARWILVKGNDLMRERLDSVTSNMSSHGASKYQSLGRAFETSLKTHLIICEWSIEHWRWYINSLEERFRHLTARAFSAPINSMNLAMRSRTNTQMTEEKSIMSIFSRQKTQPIDKWSLSPIGIHRVSQPRTYTNPETGIPQPLPPDTDDESDSNDQTDQTQAINEVRHDTEAREFSFGKLRKTHEITKQAEEAILVLKQNISVLQQMRTFYTTITKRKAFPEKIADDCRDALDDFELCVNGIENDTHIQILRLETLLSLVQDRTTLLHSILDYQNAKANKTSTNNMIFMTKDMNEIARKTKIETVSMKVITLVTLFFLPGTFISVGRTFLAVSFGPKAQD